MKITISQQGKKLLVSFKSGKVVDNYAIDKADGFLNVLDKFLKKSDNLKSAVAKASFEFVNVGVLTERIIRSIIIGLRF